MSQQKVDEYKEEKKGRKERLKKEKIQKKIWMILGPILAIVIIGGLGALVYFLPTLTDKAQSAVAASNGTDESVSGDQIDYDELIRLLNEQQAANGSADAQGTDAEGTTAPSDAAAE